LSKNILPSDDGRKISSIFPQSFLKRVQNDVFQYGLWQKGDTLIVAVSGGPDSMCLLDVMYCLSKKYELSIHVAHVNYHLRGDDSEADEALVRSAAGSYRLPCSIYHSYLKVGKNAESRLRSVRYDFFESLRKDNGAAAIVIAHNEDDQAETFLLRLLRGSGMQGLASMRQKNGFILRPLLGMKRDEIVKYLAQKNISYREDLSNKSRLFLRNRIRHDLLPMLEREYQPRLKAILAENAALLADDYDYLAQSAPVLSSLKKTSDRVTFSCSEIASYPDASVRYVLRMIVTPFLGGYPPSKGTIREIVKIIRSTKQKHKRIAFCGLKLARMGDTIVLLVSQ